MDISVKDLHVILKTHHLDPNHIFGHGMLHPGYFLRWGQIGRKYTVSHILSGMDWNLGQSSGNTIFIRWQQFTSTDELVKINQQMLHNPIDNIDLMQRTKLTIDHWVSKIGNTSLTLQYKLLNNDTGKIIGYGMSQLVCVDIGTRKPVNISDDAKTSVKNMLQKDKQSSQLLQTVKGTSKIEIPKGVFVYHYHTTAPFSGSDYNGHMNQAYYVTLFLDAISSAISDHAFLNLPRDMKFLQPRQYSFLYIKECNAGDLLDVNVWRHSEKDFVFYFHVFIKNTLIHQSQILFYNASTKMSKL